MNPANRCLMLTSRQDSCLKADCADCCCRPSIQFFSFSIAQIPPPAAQEPPVSDTADLLGLNSDSQTPSMASSSAAHQGVQGGMKAATSNSNLLDDLFAPPAGEAAPVQEDLFFSEQTNETAVNSACMS